MSLQNQISLSRKKIEREVCVIAEPLLNNSPVEFFYYGRNYPNGGAFRLTTNDNYFQTWLVNKHAWAATYLPQGLHLWNDSQPVDQIKIREEQFQYGNGLFWIQHHAEYTEIFGYAPAANQSLAHFILNQKSMIEKFNFYFKDKAKKMIHKAEKNLIFAAAKQDIPTDINASQTVDRNKLMSSTQFKTFEFNSHLGVSLGFKEQVVFQGILKGETAKKIAESLNVSQKTAETYMYRLKNKFQCKTRAELIKLAFDLGLISVNGCLENH